MNVVGVSTRSRLLMTGIALVIASGGISNAQARKPAQKPEPKAPLVAAVVNGEQITAQQIVDEVLADQEARLKASNPQFLDRARPIAASIGALVMKKMGPSLKQPASVSRQDIAKWLMEEKSPVIREAVQNRIRERAIIQAGKSRGVKVTDAQIKQQVAKSIGNARTQLRLQGKTDAQVLAELGYRPDTIQRGVLASLYLEGLVRKELETKLGRPLGPEDYLEGRHILVKVNTQPPAQDPSATTPPPPVDTEKAYAEAKTKIDAIAQEIANKAKTFEKAASESSDDPSKFQEGKLGVFVRGQMVPEFEAVAFSLPVGVVSQPVRTQFGWHLIRIDRVGKDLTAAEKDQAWQGYMRNRVQPLISEIMSKAKIVNNVGAPEPAMGFPGMR